LSNLDNRYARDQAEIAIIYGRRRIGKSALLYHWCQGKPHLFFFAPRLPPKLLLNRFSRQIVTARTAEPAAPEFTYPDWETAFTALADLAREQRFIVVVDEYPNIVRAEPAVSSLLQGVWDRVLQHTHLFLVLTGSILGIIRRETLAADAPLYRRHTWPFELQPMLVGDLVSFFPDYSAEDLVETYAVLGGMPYYLNSVSPHTSLLKNIEQEILSPSGSLFNEVRLQLHEEIRGDVDTSVRLLEAIAQGAHRRADICRAAGLSSPQCQRYLNMLQELGLLEHRLPLERVRIGKRRWGTYHLRDPFIRFWHRWVALRQDLLTIGIGTRETLDQVRMQMPYIVAPVWEQIARTHLQVASGQAVFPFHVHEVGSWWTRGVQIDIVAVNRQERRVIFGEAKWTRSRLTEQHLEALIERGNHWLAGDTARWDVHYALFGLDFGRVRELAESEKNIHCFTPQDVVRMVRSDPLVARVKK
jgi:AAA+ ATPase superfamily predicted ATPase